MAIKQQGVRCRCGHRVGMREVTRTEWYVDDDEGQYVYVRYRCSKCRRIGQKWVSTDQWNWDLLRVDRSELTEEEERRFASFSRIDTDQVLEFHNRLAGAEGIPADLLDSSRTR